MGKNKEASSEGKSSMGDPRYINLREEYRKKRRNRSKC